MKTRGIFLTPAAADRVRRFLDREGGDGLRLAVRRTGCSGWAYVVELAEQRHDGDLEFEDQGVRILIDPASLSMIDGSTVDYVRDGLNWAFEFRNPNVTDECGCGESFTVAAGN
ncbi:MAG: iron-sulfur cluster assembly protein IscA [Gammaproteobacteria bacterium HGW-Gammaproteobacteria-8]|nr:MAG: iron-sulfur cluster assembly protein IscA [Gammaproteobacteria bacterium HGW-Gammaproteobacteria-8]